MHSWRVLILPFLEQKALHDQYRFDEPWDGQQPQLHDVIIPSSAACRRTTSSRRGNRATWRLSAADNVAGSKATKPSDLRDGTETHSW
jgi:hypothetical protein